MNIGSVEFFVLFLPACWALYRLGPGKAVFQNAVLLAFNAVFYFSWTPTMAWVMALSIAINYMSALGVQRWKDHPTLRRLLFWGAVFYNVGQLFILKYAGFFVGSLLDLVGEDPAKALSSLHFILPIGISFWTLQLIAYQVDVARGRFPACRQWLTFATFVSFFPQVPSGPISRPHELIPQFATARRVDATWISKGATALFVGYCLKFLVADGLASFLVVPALSHPTQYSTLSVWLGFVAYAVQIFGDFAGYSLMAIGCGRLFGVELPQNFTYPFFSTTMMDFWRRWHITLNSWLFDYLYGPLMTSRGFFRGRYDVGFVVVFGLSGLWHGASWPFVIWGLIHGIGLAVHRRWDDYVRGLCRSNRVWVGRRKSFLWKVGAWVITQGFFVVSLVPFKAQTLDELRVFVQTLAGSPGQGLGIGHVGMDRVMALAAAATFVAYNLGGTNVGRRAWARFERLPPMVRGVVYGLVVVVLLMVVPVGSGNFIYAQF